MDFLNTVQDLPAILVVFILALMTVICVEHVISIWNLPPGPWGFPLVGHLPLLGKYPHLTFMKLSRKYGSVFQIRMGSRRTVVINGYNAIHEALVDAGIDFAGRPDFDTFKCIAKDTSFVFKNISPRWRLHHKITQTALRKFSTNRKPPIDRTITDEAQELVDELLHEKNAFMSPSNNIFDAVSSTLLGIIFGSRFEDRHDPTFNEFNRTVHELNEILEAGDYPGDLIPWLKPFGHGILKKHLDLNNQLIEFVLPRIKEHLTTFQRHELRDTLDVLIQAAQDIPESEKVATGLTDEAILLTVITLIIPAITTVSDTLNWALLYMAYFPEIQKLVQTEIDETIGSSRYATSADRGSLPYTEACVLEIMRYSSISNLGLPHCTVCDTRLQGYHIPKNTMVFINLYSVSYDETVWESPKSFSPERFLSSDHKSVDKNTAERSLPFGLGKRRCPGEYFAKLEVFLFFVTLMQRCRFRVCPDHPVSLEPVCMASLVPQPYKIIIESRN